MTSLARLNCACLGLALFASLAPAAHATSDALQNDFPLISQLRTFHGEALSTASLKHINDDFDLHREALKRLGGKKLAKTDEGYGPKFRARYHLRDAFVDIYSGVNDGWLSEWHVSPMSFADALRLAETVEKAQKHSVNVNFAHPTHKSATSVTYESEGSGCSESVTFKLDAKGRCIEIDAGGAC